MPRHDWFQHIELKGASARRGKNIPHEQGGQSDMPEGRHTITYYKIGKHQYMPSRIGNHKTALYRFCDLAAVCGVNKSTIMRWYKNGMLPLPYFSDPARNRNWGWPESHYYITEQVHVIAKVLNDVFAQSSQYRMQYTEHAEMMKAGDEMVRERIPYKAVKPKRPKSVIPQKQKTPLHMRPAPRLRPLLKAIRADLKRRNMAT